MKRNHLHIILFILVNINLFAQEVNVIDNKGTIISVRNNQVTTSNTAPTNPVENDIWFDTTNPDNIITKIYEVTAGTGSWVELIKNSWSLNGNAGTDSSTNFLGTTDSQDLVLKTNNTEGIRILQNNQYVGMGINNPTSPLHIRRNVLDGVGLLRLEGTEPDINFNDTNGGWTTFTFENNGVGKVLIGRDIDDNFYISRKVGTNVFWEDQTFRILNSNGNVGINIARPDVPTEKLDVNGRARIRTLDEGDLATDQYVVATPTGVLKKVNTNFKSIIVTSSPYTLTDNDYTVVINNLPPPRNTVNRTITIPTPAASNRGRIIVVKNMSGRTLYTSENYFNFNGISTNVLVSTGTNKMLQSDGTNWYQIN